MRSFNPILIVVSILTILLFVSIITVLSSCGIPPQEPEFKIPIIKTDKQKSSLCLMPQYMMNAWYDLECVKPFCSEFDPDRKYADTMKTHQFWKPTEEVKQTYSKKGLVVIVDTIHEITMTKRPIWASYLFHRSFDDNRPLLQDDTLTQDVKSFPVYIANVSNTKTATIEIQDGSIMMIVEAQDKHRKWRAIEYWSHSWCGNSYYTLDIPPQYFAFTRGVKCSGDFLTSCRLKVLNGGDSLYSNEFKMSISTNQFNRPVSYKER
ncbi:MAG: hypothetical protein K0S53_813 [Bacteroidetes bacterium]|jgi:hypothetical protein|nr:hypothetical protein [Bacteroidota bacterium]